jgi:hypothetical protein
MKKFRFDPQPDISAFEVATMLARAELTLDEEALEKQPADMRRHFKEHLDPHAIISLTPIN